jgi:hypothetical protein
MKLDKDTLVKQRFWFLLPLGLVLIFMALGSVWSINSEAEQKYREVVTKVNSVQQAGNKPVVSDQLIEILRKQREDAERLKQQLWEQLFGLQNQVELEGEVRVIRRPFIIWPEHEAFQEFAVFDFGEPLDRKKFPHELFRNFFPRLYEDLLGILPLYDEKTGRGAVRANPHAGAVRGGGGPGKPRGLFGAAPGNIAVAEGITTREQMLAVLDPPTFGEGTLTADEIWTALEDVAIKRELLLTLASVLDNFATLHPEFQPLIESESESAKPPEKTPAKPDKVPPGLPVKAPFGAKPTEQPPASPEGIKPAGQESADKPAEKAETKKPGPSKPQRRVLFRERFYNTVWHYDIAPPELKDPQQPLPVLGREEGWLLEVQVSTELAEAEAKATTKKPAREYYLEITSFNYSPRFEIPKMPLRIWLETTQGQRFYVDVPDAGSVAKAAAETGKPATSASPPPATRTVEPVRFQLPPTPAKPDGKPAGDDEPEVILGIQRPPPAGALDYHRLANPHWIVDVELRRAKEGAGYQLIGVLYNRSGRRQVPPAFEFTLSDGTNELKRELRPVKEPLDSYHARKFEETLLLAQQVRQIVGVKQVLDWQTAPIKRIDTIRIGEPALAQADRIWHVRLQFYPFHKKQRPGQEDVLGYSEVLLRYIGGGGAGSAGAAPGAGPKPGFGGGTGPGGDAGFGFGQQQAGGETSRNGIALRRYFPQGPSDTRDMPDTLPEVRRLPIALVVIADYPAMSDILTAMANSRLRIQVTQTVWARTPPLGPPPPPAGTKPAPGGTKPGAATAPKPDTSGAAGADVVGSEAAEVNLIELQIYGLATIYENPYRREEFQQSGGGGPRIGPPGGGGRPGEWRPWGGDSRGRSSPFGGGSRRFRGRR